MLWSVLLVASCESRAADLVDRVVAVVDGEPLLASEVAFDDEVDGLLGGADPGLGADVLERALRRAVVRRSAERVSLNVPGEDLVRAEVERIRLAAGSALAWASLLDRFGLDDAGLLVWTRRRLIVARWIDRQIAGLDASIQHATASGLIDAVVARASIRRVDQGREVMP